MTLQYGEAFDVAQAVADVEALLTEPVPAGGPTVSEEQPATEEWTLTRGEGFVLIPLWEGPSLLGLYDPEWNEAVEAGDELLAGLVQELYLRWGAHRKAAMHVPLFRKQEGEPMPPVYQALCDHDSYGDLTVWGPVPVGGEGGADRWVALSVGHSDGDAPLVMVAVATDRPIIELEE